MIRDGMAYCDECKGVISKGGVAVEGRLLCPACAVVFRAATRSPAPRRHGSWASYFIGLVFGILAIFILIGTAGDADTFYRHGGFALLLVSAILIVLARRGAAAKRLTTCPSCDGMLSKKATICPHCGWEKAAKPSLTRGLGSSTASGLKGLGRGLGACAGLLVIIAIFLAGCLGCGVMAVGGTERATSPRASHEVVRVIDGDTIEVRVTWADYTTVEKVRLIGIDAPEKGKAYYAEAKVFLTNLLTGERVYLEYTSTDRQPRDRYGRLLAYVSREPDGLAANVEALRQGYVKVYPGIKHDRSEAFVGAETHARERRKGLWALQEESGSTEAGD